MVSNLRNYIEVELDNKNVLIESDSNVNGAENVTLTYKIIIESPLEPEAIIKLYIPIASYEFLQLGLNDPTKYHCMIQDCNREYTLKGGIFASPSPLSEIETEIPYKANDPFIMIIYDDSLDNGDPRSTYRNTLEIYLDNKELIEKGTQLRIRMYPMKNPSVFTPLPYFGGKTLDSMLNNIEYWSGASYQTS